MKNNIRKRIGSVLFFALLFLALVSISGATSYTIGEGNVIINGKSFPGAYSANDSVPAIPLNGMIFLKNNTSNMAANYSFIIANSVPTAVGFNGFIYNNTINSASAIFTFNTQPAANALIINPGISIVVVNSTIFDVYNNGKITGIYSWSIDNVSQLNYIVVNYPKINKHLYLDYGDTYLNSTLNLTITAPSKPTVSYSSSTKYISINESTQYLNQTQPIITSNTATINFINYTIVPPPPVVVSLGSYNASWASSVAISKSSSIYSVTGTINQIPKLHINKSFVPSWTTAQNYQNNTYGINITVAPIPKLNLVKTITPSWTSNELVSNSIIGLNITVLQIPKLNITQTAVPSWTQNQSLSNTLYGMNITVLKIPLLNINKVILPSWTSKQTISNSTIGLNITIAQIPKLNLTQTELPGQEYKNSTYGISFLAAPITASMLTTNDLISYYNSQTANCLSYINFTNANGTKYSICARGAGQSNYSIVDICTGLAKYTNISSGLAGCVGAFAQLANSSAVYWHRQYLTTFEQLQNVTSQFQAYKSGAAAGAAYAQTAYMFAGIIGLMILAMFVYELNKKRTQLSVIRPPINKV